LHTAETNSEPSDFYLKANRAEKRQLKKQYIQGN
jgi:hypothetical protein